MVEWFLFTVLSLLLLFVSSYRLCIRYEELRVGRLAWLLGGLVGANANDNAHANANAHAHANANANANAIHRNQPSQTNQPTNKQNQYSNQASKPTNI